MQMGAEERDIKCWPVFFILIFCLESQPLGPTPHVPDYPGCVCTDHGNASGEAHPTVPTPGLPPNTRSAPTSQPLGTPRWPAARVMFSYPDSLTGQHIQLTESQESFWVCQRHSKNSQPLLVESESWGFSSGDFNLKFNTNLNHLSILAPRRQKRDMNHLD